MSDTDSNTNLQQIQSSYGDVHTALEGLLSSLPSDESNVTMDAVKQAITTANAHSVTSPVQNDTGYEVDTLGINKQTGQAWLHNSNTGSFLFLQGAGDYASNSDLSAEVQRAKQAESGYLPLTGGTLTGTLTVSQTVGDSNLQIRPQNGMNGYMSVFRDGAYQQFGCAGGTIDQANIIMYKSDLSEYKKWSFDRPSGTIISPSGNVYPEIIGMSGRVVIQTYQTTIVDGQFVLFPQAFSSPPVSIQLTCQHSSTDSATNVINFVYNTVTNTGFKASVSWFNGGLSYSNSANLPCFVTAIGVMQ